MPVPNRIIARTFALAHQTKVSPVCVPTKCTCHPTVTVYVPGRHKPLRIKHARKWKIRAAPDFTRAAISCACHFCSDATVKTIAVTIPTKRDVQHRSNPVPRTCFRAYRMANAFPIISCATTIVTARMAVMKLIANLMRVNRRNLNATTDDALIRSGCVVCISRFVVLILHSILPSMF